jgi:capsular polysaccharide biosynthesis protein
MKEISHLLRKAYLDKLDPFIIDGITIPVFDEMVNPSVQIPTYKGASCYIVVLDQNEVETSNNDNSFRQNAVIGFDVVCKSHSIAGKLASELISNQLQESVHELEGQTIQIDETGIQVFSTTKIFSRSFKELGASLTSYRKRITFSNIIYES